METARTTDDFFSIDKEDIEFSENIDPEKTMLIAVSLITVMAAIFIGGVLSTGILAGFFLASGILLLVFKLKREAPKIWNTMLEHEFETDILLSCAIALVAGPGSATGLIAAGAAAIMVSGTLKYFKATLGYEKDQNGEIIKGYSLSFGHLFSFGKKKETTDGSNQENKNRDTGK